MEAMLQGNEWESTTTTICLRNLVPNSGGIFLPRQSISKSLSLHVGFFLCHFKFLPHYLFLLDFVFNKSFKMAILIMGANLFLIIF